MEPIVDHTKWDHEIIFSWSGGVLLLGSYSFSCGVECSYVVVLLLNKEVYVWKVLECAEVVDIELALYWNHVVYVVLFRYIPYNLEFTQDIVKNKLYYSTPKTCILPWIECQWIYILPNNHNMLVFLNHFVCSTIERELQKLCRFG